MEKKNAAQKNERERWVSEHSKMRSGSLYITLRRYTTSGRSDETKNKNINKSEHLGNVLTDFRFRSYMNRSSHTQ